jgi:hypothetical protein
MRYDPEKPPARDV